MNNNRSLPTIPIAIAAFVVGIAFGLFVLGWWLFPPIFVDAGPRHFEPRHMATFIKGVAQEQNPNSIMNAVCYPTADYDAIFAYQYQPREGEDPQIQQQVLNARQHIVNVVAENGGCEVYKERIQAQGGAEAPAAEGEGGLGGIAQTLCLLALVLAIVLMGLFLLMRRRGGEDTDDYDDDDEEEQYTRRRTRQRQPSASRPPASRPEPTPLAGFQTTYIRGDDSFDKSFIIENANGDFLGECGVSISESVEGSGDSRQVTAFEIWLFDKNDTHTVTKVIMSDHAYNDDGIRAKLATRGEPVLAQFDETVALETVGLIINAEVTEIDYDGDVPPPRSVFDRFTIDLSAWVKSNTPAPRRRSSIDELD